MSRLIFEWSAVLSVALLLVSCGQTGENYPTGVTGGGGGYGSTEEAVIQAGIDARLLGMWWANTPFEASYELVFHANGFCDFKVYWIGVFQDSSSGRWQADGTWISIEIDQFGPERKRYWVSAETFETTFLQLRMEFHREL